MHPDGVVQKLDTDRMDFQWQSIEESLHSPCSPDRLGNCFPDP